VTSYIERLLARLRPHAQDLVDAFGYGPEHVRATIATGVEGERQREAREHARRARADGTAPRPERSADRPTRPERSASVGRSLRSRRTG